ncbi:Rpn family recombination-promoting nuclease/putative transposase [Erwiniaceae bacterium BAC15a-03b]|uniref:Rpn family recombination-promoting nuclease/putative transposase n=1 Tax=Winslowiella arboricola TaxID=2978220 RepID=A0A9J6PQG4_9GAMM|nr:Rpn family recombination-promoting nuclease/putative transposase [Winslowiella arboricola]MCU5774087.1 Rpn family recombination-promoting nuclease/putative transposase [Winslowiella arboricola]MCU5776980.1 Rpn family recombination-promoting nuclease/putative transposase [Winslowiella arboricola]
MTGATEWVPPPTPHDAVFKQFLSHPDTARDFLQIHLPPALLQDCNLDTLHLEPCSFVEKNLRAFYADVLYSVQTDSGEGYIYCLIEHQSSPDKNMPFRLMRYAFGAMQRHLDYGHERLPLVIPILFYHGNISPYPYPMNWLQTFDDPERAGQLYSGDFPLVDITTIPDEEIMQHRGVALLEYLHKHSRQRDLLLMLEPLATLIKGDYTTRDQLIAAMNYMLQVGETADPKSFMRALAERTGQYEELMMTAAEKLRQEGRQEERLQTKLEIARKMLSEGLDTGKIMKMTGLTEEELNRIRH